MFKENSKEDILANGCFITPHPVGTEQQNHSFSSLSNIHSSYSFPVLYLGHLLRLFAVEQEVVLLVLFH